jgi:hypothetical protein
MLLLAENLKNLSPLIIIHNHNRTLHIMVLLLAVNQNKSQFPSTVHYTVLFNSTLISVPKNYSTRTQQCITFIEAFISCKMKKSQFTSTVHYTVPTLYSVFQQYITQCP